MKHQLSFGKVIILNDNIAEVIANRDIEMSIEMVEECDDFLATQFTGSFGLLVNKINSYKYTYEAKLTLGTNENMKAVAIINYHSEGVIQTERLAKLREVDNLNLKSFSGLELGWQQGFDWLKKELTVSNR